jgi:hypothetical protein
MTSWWPNLTALYDRFVSSAFRAIERSSVLFEIQNTDVQPFNAERLIKTSYSEPFKN